MITVIYDPENGCCCPDNHLLELAEDLYNANKNSFVRVGSEMLIYAYRILVKRKVIPHTSIQFMFKDIIIPVKENGNFHTYPNGFADESSKFLLELLDWEDSKNA